MVDINHDHSTNNDAGAAGKTVTVTVHVGILEFIKYCLHHMECFTIHT